MIWFGRINSKKLLNQSIIIAKINLETIFVQQLGKESLLIDILPPPPPPNVVANN